MTPSPRRTRSQKEKTQYVDNNDDDDFDNDQHKIKNEVKVHGDQRTVWGGGVKLELLAPKLNVSEKKKEKAKNGDKFAKKWS